MMIMVVVVVVVVVWDVSVRDAFVVVM